MLEPFNTPQYRVLNVSFKQERDAVQCKWPPIYRSALGVVSTAFL